MINVEEILSSARPEELEYPPPSEDHISYIEGLSEASGRSYSAQGDAGTP